MSDPPPDLTGLPRSGDVVAGRYKVEGVLGTGGMGVVMSAREVSSGRRAALKFLLPSAARVPQAKARFLREAKAAGAIRSEHVARVIEVGELENGAPFMVLEYLEGADFSAVLKQRRRLPVAEAVDLVLQAAVAVVEAHALGIVHRDLKPSNLFLTVRADRSPLVKVIDFGLSKMTAPNDLGARDASLTANDFAMGSPYYMSPEQLRGLKHVDARTDVWALGVILYELLAGRRPFDGTTLTAVCASIAADTQAPLTTLREDVPAALDALIGRCLEKDIKRRIQTVDELVRGLQPFGTGEDAVQVDFLTDPPPPLSSGSPRSAPRSNREAPAVPAPPSSASKARTAEPPAAVSNADSPAAAPPASQAAVPAAPQRPAPRPAMLPPAAIATPPALPSAVATPLPASPSAIATPPPALLSAVVTPLPASPSAIATPPPALPSAVATPLPASSSTPIAAAPPAIAPAAAPPKEAPPPLPATAVGGEAPGAATTAPLSAWGQTRRLGTPARTGIAAAILVAAAIVCIAAISMLGSPDDAPSPAASGETPSSGDAPTISDTTRASTAPQDDSAASPPVQPQASGARASAEPAGKELPGDRVGTPEPKGSARVDRVPEGPPTAPKPPSSPKRPKDPAAQWD